MLSKEAFMYFEELVGNEQTKSMLVIAAKSAKGRNTSVPHVLFGGSAGCGKTSFANALANFLNVPFFQVDAAGIKTSDDVFRIVEKFPLSGYNDKGEATGEVTPPIVFIDEIHQLSLKGTELLGIAMENFILPMEVGRGKTKEKRVIWVPRFSLVGATTLTGRLPKPLRDRFKLQCKFDTYSIIECTKIVFVHAKKLDINISPLSAMLIGRRCRGVARMAVRFLEMARDHSMVHGKDIVDEEVVCAMFEFLDIDMDGFTAQDRKILSCLYKNKEPLGLDSIAVLLNESQDTVAKEVEPYLIVKGLVLRTARGRILTDEGVAFVKQMLGDTSEKGDILERLTIKDKEDELSLS